MKLAHKVLVGILGTMVVVSITGCSSKFFDDFGDTFSKASASQRNYESVQSRYQTPQTPTRYIGKTTSSRASHQTTGSGNNNEVVWYTSGVKCDPVTSICVSSECRRDTGECRVRETFKSSAKSGKVTNE